MARDAATLETFPNPHPNRAYCIQHHVHEFTSLCPRTGHPDFAEIDIHYVPAEKCLELKSLKLYLQSFRNEGIFYEDVTNLILTDLAARCAPAWMRIRTVWSVRGGIHSTIVAECGSKPPATPDA